MTLQYGSEHANAIAALIASMPTYLNAPDPATLTDAQFPYVVLIVPDGVRTSERLAGRPDQRTVYFQTRVVGFRDDQVRWAQAKVADALAGARPGVAGFGSNVIHKTSSIAPARDDDAGARSIFTAVDTWSLSTMTA